MINSRNQAQATKKAQIENKHYLADAVRFNVFSLEKQQADKPAFIRVALFFCNLIAIMFDSLLHVNLGRDYANPIDFALGLIKSLIEFFRTGLAGTLLILLFLLFLLEAATDYDFFSLILRYLGDFLTTKAVGIFLIAGFMAMTLQAMFAFARSKEKQHFSHSNGTPWLFYLTRMPFLTSFGYVVYIEPLIIIIPSCTIFFISEIEPAKYFIFFGLLYLIRNIYAYSLIDREQVKRHDMEIQSAVEQATAQAVMQKPLNSGHHSKNPHPTRKGELEDFIE